MLRPYQQEAFDNAKKWMSSSVEPCLLELATGAGKSHIVAAIAHWLNERSGKRVLCLAPSKELTEQNHAKYLATGEPASIYSASIGKSLRHDVVFGTPQTVKNSIDKFRDKFCAVIIDEAHGITKTIKTIILEMQRDNPKLRIIGLTATPYRTKEGYIYRYDEKGAPVPDTMAQKPHFHSLICKITAHDLIKQAYLTPPSTVTSVSDHYDTSRLTGSNFDQNAVNEAFNGNRKTSKIVAEIIEVSHNRKGVMIFGSTIRHCEEIISSLPRSESALITGKTPKTEREHLIKQFKNQQIKYMVNVSILNTGFDAPHVDVVALLRATESAGLMQQIIGRGLRLYDGKKDCLVMDYAENIERHCPHGDIFSPEIKTVPPKGDYKINANCPLCKTDNIFSGRPNPENFKIDKEGYFIDGLGVRIADDDGIEYPAHFGRRCFGHKGMDENGKSKQCNYRWIGKTCDSCGHENDIAARYCEACDNELVDPNEKLFLEFQKIKADPYTVSTDRVLSWSCSKHISAAGNETLKVNYTTECRSFTIWYLPRKQSIWHDLSTAVYGKFCPDVDTFLKHVNKYGKMPTSVTVQRDKGSKFYSVYRHNRQIDEIQ
jgi:DNA repair protein RadD